jgi:hypothetical protein
MPATWSAGVGWFVFILGMIAGFYMFNRYKRLYTLFYLISICVYIFTIAYAIDVFSLGRGWILILLLLSAALFLLLGYYFSHIISEASERKR